jgi:hypothetical protein
MSLALFLDTLIPGDAEFPAPSSLDLAPALLAHDRFGAYAREIAELIPLGFIELDANARESAAQKMEERQPELFAAFVTGLYSLYYTHAQVLGVIAAIAGYVARPPQPEGYELPPFDEAVLETTRKRAPHFRSAGDSA